ncbi:MAG: GldG family protein [Myxococcales bacterium]|nr:GldG family protein [Myxococcales bacterium]
MNSKAWGRIGGLFGLVVLFSAVFNWLFVTGSIASAGVIARLVLGVAGVAFWLITNRSEHPLGRGAFYGTISAVSAAVLVAALVGVNYIAVKKPKSWDLTKDKIFTLSDQTTGVLKGLKDEVKVSAFYAASEPEYPELEQRLRQYSAQSDKLKVEYVDPFKHPAMVKEMNISQTGPRVIVKSGSKESRAKEITEEALTNALIDVTRGSAKKVYFTKGHGEHAVADSTERGLKLLVESLKSEGYQTDEIVLAEHKEMPADVAALVVAGPVGQFTDGEVKLVKDWVDKGGKIVAMIDPGVTTGFEGAFQSWGIQLGKDEVIDPEAQNPEIAIAQQYTEHPITQPRNSAFQLATIFPVARSVSKFSTPPAGWTVVELAKTGPRAWGETSSLTSGQVKFDPGQDLKGPVTLATSASKGESRVVVIGNSLFAANGYLRLSGNKDFALNSVAWSAHEESRISIRPKQRQSNHLFLSAEQKHRMTLFAFDLLPFGLLFAGLVVWQTRKSR